MLALESYIDIHEGADKWQRRATQLTDYVRYINTTKNDALVVETNDILRKTDNLMWWTKHSRKAVESIKKLVFNGNIVDYLELRELFPDGWGGTSQPPGKDIIGMVLGEYESLEEVVLEAWRHPEDEYTNPSLISAMSGLPTNEKFISTFFGGFIKKPKVEFIEVAMVPWKLGGKWS
jgi:hypothetical protein